MFLLENSIYNFPRGEKVKTKYQEKGDSWQSINRRT